MTHPTNPYAAPTAVVDDIQTNNEGLELAGRGIRLGASLLDGIIMAALIWIPIMIFMGFDALARFAAWQAERGILGGVAMLLGGFVLFLVVNGYLLHKNGQTIGKRLLGIKIVRTDGEAADLPRILLFRYGPGILANVIPFINLLYPLVDSLLIFRESRKCLHDNIADTIVVKA
ncbi:MAG TPA: RDD family protein [Burkholderiales bacterium]|jgi:uncharacterized RDD family membrane protein YckC|nr:RDD family protein [Burkholderiales bacterium]